MEPVAVEKPALPDVFQLLTELGMESAGCISFSEICNPDCASANYTSADTAYCIPARRTTLMARM